MINCVPFVISGAPRSGTSLLYNLFDGHSEVAWLVDEGYLFEYLYDLSPEGAQIFIDAMPADVKNLAAGLRDRQVIPPLHEPYRQSEERGSVSRIELPTNWDERAFLAALAESAPEAGIPGVWSRLVFSCLSGLKEAPKRYACLKAPDYGKSARAATELISDARAVVVIRDPLYALDSLKRSRELRGEKLLSWPQLALNIHYFQQMLERIDEPRDRTIVVRYESLVADPEKTLRGITDWLGISFEECLLEPTMRGVPWPGISSFEPTTGIQTDPARRPIKALSEDEQALIRLHLGDFRRRFGYDG